jgi:TonB-linked SusC/RagA family outer membrane protein
MNKAVKYLLTMMGCLCAGAAYAQAESEAGAAQRDSVEAAPRFSLGYTSQPTHALTGAVETVSGRALEASPVAELSLTFAGRFLGLTSMELASDPGNASTFKLIRGVSTVNGAAPLVIIDGMITPTDYWDYLVPQEIESVSILKDGASTSLYGMQGAGGAIVITTKRGFSGKSKIDVYAGYAVQQMTKRLSLPGSSEYIALRNQAALNDGLTPPYPQDVVSGFASGNTDLYPSNDWYNMYFRKLSAMQRAGVNIAGGSESVKFFTNLNYRHQGSLFNIDEVAGRQYDPTPGGHSLNFRSNIDASFSSRFTGFLRISGNVDLQKNVTTSNEMAYSSLFLLPPTMYGPTTPAGYEFPNEVVTTSEATNIIPYGQLNRSGFGENLTTNIMSQAGLKLDMDFIAKGLSLTGSMAYQTRATQSTVNTQTFAKYTRNARYDVLEFTRLGTDENTPLQYPPAKTASLEYNLNLYATLDYEQRSGDHYLKAMAYGMYLQQEAPTMFLLTWGSGGISLSRSSPLPYYRQNFGSSLLYGYADRYFAKVDLGYTGSEQFAKGNRYVFTPGFSAAWIASSEEFLKGNSVVSYLKLRASYGVNANDQLGTARFMYLDYYEADGKEGLKGNPDLKPETVGKQNYGFDLGVARMLTLHFDYYYHRTDNMLISGAGMSPALSGIALDNYPKLNEGSMMNSGLEASATFSREVAAGLHLTAGLGVGFNRNKVLKCNEAPRGEGFAYQRQIEGYPLGQIWGLKVDYSNGNGYINTQAELDAARSKYKLGVQPRLGDLMFLDISGDDGVIDEKDLAPIGNPSLPQVTYNANLGLSYKGLEVNLLLQGTARSSSVLLMNEYGYPGVYIDVHKGAWTAERYASGAEITYPALSYSTASVSADFNNDYSLYDASYLRLRNLEVAYTLPGRLAGFISAEAIRVAFNAQNLFTFDHTPSKYLDPETRSDFTAMSPFRVFNITLGVKF